MFTRLKAREERERAEWERRRASRTAFYADFENPSLAEFIGSKNVCETCHAVTPEMAKHMEWHARVGG